MSTPAKRVLCLLVEGFEEIETITPVDLLRRAGAEVVMASLSDGIHVTGRSRIVMHADALLSQVMETDGVSGFDLLLLPGGPGVQLLRVDGRPAALARDFAARQKPVAAICAAPLVLLDAGLLQGRRFTAHHSTLSELPGAVASERVIVDGWVTTSRGAGTALDFGLQLVRQLYGDAAAQEVAQVVMA